jgi:uncharacterized protein (TIGR02996 family)
MDEAALWQAIHDAPADERAWLVMADWLEEHDDPLRAELFRVTLTLRLRSDEAHRPALEERQRELLAAGVRPAVPEVVNSIGMRFVLVPPGTFWMGSPEGEEGRFPSEGPQHEVEISRPFYLGAYAVTQEQYQRVTGRNPGWFQAGGEGTDKAKGLDTTDFPVENVSWDEASNFCEKLSRLPEEKKAGRRYWLPTEAEWEYSCRGGVASSIPYHFGTGLLPQQANFRETGLGRPCPVGSYAPNAWGLYDMHGNVWEWCLDWSGKDDYASSPRVDPHGPSEGTYRVLRGGACGTHVRYCRSACRVRREPADRSSDLGFRVALFRYGK